jgi:pimeloyl-ACP methyl ester carboxylesterase
MGRLVKVRSASPERATFFGPQRRLFGVFDDCAAAASSQRGVVLCYPQGADYDSAFRAFRVLAARLARAGFHVLRFDYLGTGDSWGAAQDASVEQWTSDVHCAIDELRMSRGVSDVSVVGLRFGAALAALAAAAGGVDRVVLWEPVTDGAAYLAAQRALHESWMREERRNGRSAPAGDDEILGYEMPDSLRRGIERIDVASLARIERTPVHVVTQGASPAPHELVSRLAAAGAQVDAEAVEGPMVWSRTPLMPEATVPTRVLQAIVSWLEGASR